ncbi:MAG: glycosyltransferase family 2 protein [Epsilonproteobacteria bacterium]|nr:MAG: glycosyltransferase family 2 protein [Campylobacterota bacterium]
MISIITPSYKSEKFISKTIESVLSQTYKDWEMIIVDDMSPDNANKIIEEYIKKDNRIKFIKLEKNTGPAIARNRAIEEAKGRYIAFLDADDVWMPEKLEKQIDFMNKFNLDLTYSSYNLQDEMDNDLGLFITKENISYESLLKTNSIGCLTAIYDTKHLGKVYMPDIIKRQDYGLWLKILKEIGNTKGMLEPLATYRIMRNSVSSNKIDAAKYVWKIFRDVENLNFIKSCYYFCHYIYNGIRKYKS